ncbi:response regulator transcription factor [Polymorphum gilvum]|uniref:Response regulators consisting of a CheY-like receiver domain and a winged-helix DNA-binding domain n=1 Tax=Polymorphum gilvum (strain LMG 25793 / CGMCC 1.9160 / SL003B-26A1) TaxID=991905 RepID=F2J4L5_POLGS|nr:response regulator transcription factor [Polymorphum gilvum]ADZ72267.1 Response regulators consisting of a CheY-like receiver domain and a winged-helix DNA-binding domain [Polymorphum gilvum SL003B-26A1]
MFVIVDDREIVTSGYTSGFEREGFACMALLPSELAEWINAASEDDLASVEAVLLGDCEERPGFPPIIRTRCGQTPIIALEEKPCLEQTLDLFACGVDDVLRKPVHVREILARVGAIRRRTMAEADNLDVGRIRVFFDGRDPIVGGEVFELPRRERRILEYMARNHGRRVTKTQIYNAVYGLMNEEVDECVVESHVSKLRKKLKMRLGYDPIESKRYIGYMLKAQAQEVPGKVHEMRRALERV